MKTQKLIYLLSLILFVASCKKEDSLDRIKISKDMPGDHILEMQVDKNGVFYFITSEVDYSIELPPWSSMLPMRSYLSKKETETGKYQILDDNYAYGPNIFLDSKNRFWALTSTILFLKQGTEYTKVIEIPYEEGYFQVMTEDNDGNIWVGGYTHGLYKVDENLNVSAYKPDGSMLPAANITAMHADENNNVWLAMENWGIVKISRENWEFYSKENSDVTDQRIWSITTDAAGNLWMGTGHNDSSVNLMKFNGESWQVIQLKDEKGNNVSGSVRNIISYNGKLYMIVFDDMYTGGYRYQLLIFDGNNWNQVAGISEDDGIDDLIIDEHRKVVWAKTWNEGVFKVE